MSPLSMHETQHLLATEPAWLMAVAGRLWVTRRGDPADYVLAPGERLELARGDDVTLGGWARGEPASWCWGALQQPGGRYRPLRAVLAWPFDAAARALVFGAEALAALARSAASIARRAQGCMASGDSIASAGTVQ